MSEINDYLETHNYKGYSIQIYQSDSDSPADWCDDERFLVHYHRDCWITNKAVEKDEIAEWYRGNNKSLEKKYWVFQVVAYIHGGVSLSLGSSSHFPDQQWDVSHVGAVLIKRDRKLRSKKVREQAEGLIESWNHYLSGEVYGFNIINPDGDEVDSCNGYYGDIEKSGLMDECRAVIDDDIQRCMNARTDKVKLMIINKVPLLKRQEILCQTKT